MRKSFPAPSLATVYKTVEALKDVEQALELEFSGLASRCDGKKPGPHPHVICEACGRLADPEAVDVARIIAAMRRETGFSIRGSRLDFFGTGPACRQRTVRKERSMAKRQQPLTTNAGAPAVDNQNTMTAGPRGPALLQDVWFLEKLARFDREVIPERRMHAKGSGPTARSRSPATSPATRRRRSSRRWARKPTSSCVFPPWPASAAPRMPSTTSGASR